MPLRIIGLLFVFGLVSGCSDELGTERENPDMMILSDPAKRAVPIDQIIAEPEFPPLIGVVEFSQLSTAAYRPNLTELESLCDSTSRRGNKWQRDTEFDQRSFPPVRSRKLGARISGFGYGVWVEQPSVNRRRVAIVFRGTDFNQLGDWYSNARWLTRINPFTWDQYQQTRDLVPHLVIALREKYGPDVEIVAAGHSLGGGLAQHAAYASNQIKYAYAFSSSPVTGSTSRDPRVDPRNVTIIRAYESGEVLSPIRGIQRLFLPLSPENPWIKEARFNFRNSFDRSVRGGTPLSQHRSIQLSCDLVCRVENGSSQSDCGINRL